MLGFRQDNSLVYDQDCRKKRHSEVFAVVPGYTCRTNHTLIQAIVRPTISQIIYTTDMVSAFGEILLQFQKTTFNMQSRTSARPVYSALSANKAYVPCKLQNMYP